MLYCLQCLKKLGRAWSAAWIRVQASLNDPPRAIGHWLRICELPIVSCNARFRLVDRALLAADRVFPPKHEAEHDADHPDVSFLCSALAVSEVWPVALGWQVAQCPDRRRRDWLVHVSSEIKICELDADILRDQDVRRLQVVMRNLPLKLTKITSVRQTPNGCEAHRMGVRRTSLCRYDSDVRSWKRILRADSSSKCPCICVAKRVSQYSSHHSSNA